MAAAILEPDFNESDRELGRVVPQLKTEKPEQYEAFLDYCVLGCTLRELLLFYFKKLEGGEKAVPTTKMSDLTKWAKASDWIKRRQQFYLYKAAKLDRQRTTQSLLFEDNVTSIVKEATAKILTMLQFPVTETETQQEVLITQQMVGTKITTKHVIRPTKWSAGTISAMTEMVLKVQKHLEGSDARMIQVLKKKGYVITTKAAQRVVTPDEIIEQMEGIPSIESA